MAEQIEGNIMSTIKIKSGLLIEESKFEPTTTETLVNILGQTIKRDDINKLITFLAMLSAYTEDSQLNISFNAPSSSGKSFIPLEVARLFPKEDVIQVGYCSPTAFFHDVGEFNEDKQGYIVNLSKKILIFLDQPHTLLLQHLRPMLSHDKKEIQIKITDKGQKKGLKTKNIYLIGYPVVIFCSAGLNLDEQEATRFLLLSPEINQDKIREAIYEKIRKESAISIYRDLVETDPLRLKLTERIQAIRKLHITEIRIGSPASKKINELFFQQLKALKPRHQRDIGRILNLVKVFALLNIWNKKQIDGIVYADESDVEEAFKLWDTISESQELNLPPYVYNLFNDVIVAKCKEKNKNNSEYSSGGKLGLTRQEIMQKHFAAYGRFLPDWQLRQHIIPMLETAGLIIQEADTGDKRKILIYPTTLLTISEDQNNSESQGEVEPQDTTLNTKKQDEPVNTSPKTPNPCYTCGSTKFWKTKDDSINCATCYPPTSEEDVKEWIEVEGA